MMSQDAKKKVCGEFPDSCYRAFECKEHARQFIDGKFRMGCLLSYREIEDKSRRDRTEGYGHTIEPGIVTVGWVSPNPEEKTIWVKEQGYQEHHSESMNAKFCLCTSLPNVSRTRMLKEFGKYIVEINEPRRLAEDISEYMLRNGQSFLIEGCEVVYTKGQKLDRELTANERIDMSYRQKPPEFHRDCEFRIVALKLGEPCNWECKYLSGQSEQPGPKCEFIKIDLGKQLDYLSLVSCE